MKETDHAECDELTEEHWGVLQEREAIKEALAQQHNDGSIAGRAQTLRHGLDGLLQEEWLYRRKSHSFTGREGRP
jgi:hypothetical protein